MWQHCECVRVDVRAQKEVHFLCELCRLAKADPFWRRLGQPLVPAMKLIPVQPPRMSFDGRPIEEDVVQVSCCASTPTCSSMCSSLGRLAAPLNLA